MPHATCPSQKAAAIRPATFADIDDMVAIFQAAAPLDHAFLYVHQHAQDYPEDLTKYLELVFHLWISSKYPDVQVMVAEAPSLENVTVTKVAAYAVWDISHRNKRQFGSEYKSRKGKAR